MSANSYGVVVEGDYDSAVYSALIRKLTSPDAYIRVLPCRGRTVLMREFPGLLRTFEHEIEGRPVEMALVIRDADGKEPDEVEARMRTRIQDQHYRFPLGVRFHAVRNAMEAWLLADVNAISPAIKRRVGRLVTRSRSNDTPEDRLNPKETFRALLTEHGVGNTPLLCGEIAGQIDLDVLSQACPRFRIFSELVDC